MGAPRRASFPEIVINCPCQTYFSLQCFTVATRKNKALSYNVASALIAMLSHSTSGTSTRRRV